ncbi:MAG: hypothetical protein IH607_02705, partial [Firmicutes bacterium]|nr:hypothetical protein [Bacillota bacterium]
MRHPLPVGEIRKLLGEHGFLRLYGQDTHLFVSDIPRRVSGDELLPVRHALSANGFLETLDPGGLLLIDLQSERWEALLGRFQPVKPAPFPQQKPLLPVYALARLLSRHPATLERQPMDMLRAALKRYTQTDGLTQLAPQLHARCAELLRQG